jgi:dihydroxy-acid dehydratase
VADGDVIAIDAGADTLAWEVEAGEVERRRAAWSPPPLEAETGVLRRYVRTVAPASLGCVTDL